MEMRKLGRNGPLVSALGFGAMSFGGIFGPTTEAESLACLDALYDAGINFIDTANIYGMGISETVIGQWLATRKPQVVLATKAGIVNGPPRRIDNSDAYLRAELEGSLRRLGVERVDLFYIHRREQTRPLAEVIGTLERLEAEGKIGGYGLSEVAPETLREAQALHPCLAVQSEYSLCTRQPELGLIQECARLGVAFVPFSPLGRGFLGSEPLRPADVTDGFRGNNPRFTGENFHRNIARTNEFRRFCAERGWSAPAVALAWVMQKGDHLIPIPGTRRAGRMREWLPALEMRFDAGDLAAIEAVLPAGFCAGDRYGDGQLQSIERYC